MSSSSTRGAHVLLIDTKYPYLGLVVEENGKVKHFGGGFVPGETPRATAKREVLDEECRLQPTSPIYQELQSAIEKPDAIYAIKKFDNRLQIFPIKGEPKYTPEAKVESIYFIKHINTQALDLKGCDHIRIVEFSVEPVFYHCINGHLILAWEMFSHGGY